MIVLIVLCIVLLIAIGAFALLGSSTGKSKDKSKGSKPRPSTTGSPVRPATSTTESPVRPATSTTGKTTNGSPTRPTTSTTGSTTTGSPTRPTTSTTGSPTRPVTTTTSNSGYNSILLTQDNVQELIDLLNAGKAVGSSRSLYDGYYLNNMTNHRLDQKNHFKDITNRARDAYKKVCNEGQNCDRIVAQGTPVWTNPVIESDEPFMKSLSDRVEKCIREPSKKCFSDNMPYVVDLDNYGPPRMQSLLAKMLAFIVDMRDEARAFTPRNDQERMLRDTFANQNAFFRVHLYSVFKKDQNALCPSGAYACAGGMNGLLVPVFIDPHTKGYSDYYTFLHELSHVLERKSMMADGPSSFCFDRNHASSWHKCFIFLAHMALLVLRKRGIVPENHMDMTPFLSNPGKMNQYHACFFEKGLPNFTNPTIAW